MIKYLIKLYKLGLKEPYNVVGISLDKTKNILNLESLNNKKLNVKSILFPMLIRELRYYIINNFKPSRRKDYFRICYDNINLYSFDIVFKTCTITRGGFIKDEKVKYNFSVGCNKFKNDIVNITLEDYVELVNFLDKNITKDLLHDLSNAEVKRKSKKILKSISESYSIERINDSCRNMWKNPSENIFLQWDGKDYENI